MSLIDTGPDHKPPPWPKVPPPRAQRGPKKKIEKMDRICFVTTGATAPFPELIAKVLSSECLAEFEKEGFTKMFIQCGDLLTEFKAGKLIPPKGTCKLAVEVFDFKNSLHDDMRLCQAKEGARKQGLIIMHAGKKNELSLLRFLDADLATRRWKYYGCYAIGSDHGRSRKP